jgi:D-alanine-D-alanine ligase
MEIGVNIIPAFSKVISIRKGVARVKKKIKVGVIFGGKSGEHEVSVQSAKSVMESLDPTKYTIVPIGISKQGNWYVGDGAIHALQEGSTVAGAVDSASSNLPDVTQGGQSVPSSLTEEIDVVIPVLHGTFGEDGSIQGMLELLDVPYVGAGILASAVGLDKVFMKTVFLAAGLPQVLFTSYTRREWEKNRETVALDVEEKLGYPCFVKPANLGSSVGISKVKNREDLYTAMDFACRYDRKIIVEEGLDVREIEIAVLGNEDPKASVPGEVVPSNEFYDYEAKYMSGDSTLMIPAPLSPEQTQEIRELAVRAFQAVDCTGLARVDFFIEKNTSRILVNEINTMPGFTAFSMYPKLWEATGIPYAELIDKLIQFAIERYEDKKRITYDFQSRD